MIKTKQTQKQKEKERILNHLLEHVPYTGWSASSLHIATKEAGFEEGYEKIVFKNGVQDTIDLFLDSVHAHIDTQLLKQAQELKPLPIREKIATLIEWRLYYLEPYKGCIIKLCEYTFSPVHTITMLEKLWQASDHMWHSIGDQSTDWNYYSKRMLLSSVYSSTLLYWINDKSNNFEDTKAFIRRRIDNVLVIGKLKQTVQSYWKQS